MGWHLALWGKFSLTLINTEFTLIYMDKQEIKKRLLEAVKRDPHLDDIKSIALFGSYVTGQPSQDSDVDVLIDFEPSATIGFFDLAHIKRNFEKFLDMEIDLLTPPAISRFFRDEVLKQAEYFYEKR